MKDQTSKQINKKTSKQQQTVKAKQQQFGGPL